MPDVIIEMPAPSTECTLSSNVIKPVSQEHVDFWFLISGAIYSQVRA